MKKHTAYEYLLNPQHKLTVALIGCGGTGSQVLSILARMNTSLMALGHLGLHVEAFDDDKITEANLGRQLFSEAEVGSYKVISLMSRMNRFYGTNWCGNPEKFTSNDDFNIYITCVDDLKTRFTLADRIKGRNQRYNHHDRQRMYWLDFGNTNSTGQAILGSLYQSDDKKEAKGFVPMPCFDEWIEKYVLPKPKKNVPSCSLAEALEKQDLLINSTLANAGMHLLWKLIRTGSTPHNGIMLNLDTLTSNPIPL